MDATLVEPPLGEGHNAYIRRVVESHRRLRMCGDVGVSATTGLEIDITEDSDGEQTGGV